MPCLEGIYQALLLQMRLQAKAGGILLSCMLTTTRLKSPPHQLHSTHAGAQYATAFTFVRPTSGCARSSAEGEPEPRCWNNPEKYWRSFWGASSAMTSLPELPVGISLGCAQGRKRLSQGAPTPYSGPATSPATMPPENSVQHAGEQPDVGGEEWFPQTDEL